MSEAPFECGECDYPMPDRGLHGASPCIGIREAMQSLNYSYADR